MLSLILIALIVKPDSTQAICGEWVSIPPNDYSQTYVSATDKNAATTRPYGYMPMTAVFGATDKPCVTVSNSSGNGRHYEIAIDSPSGTACVEATEKQQQCIERGALCDTVTGNDRMKLTFDCTSCEGSEVTFWYRVVLEDSTDGNYNENWCQTRTPKYPESLKQTGSIQVIPPPVDEDTRGSAVGMTARWYPILFVTIFATILSRLL